MTSFEPVNICLVGTSNFAASHYSSLRRLEDEGLARQTCAIVRRPQVYAEAVADYQARGIKVYHSYDEMLQKERGQVELIALATAIPDHFDNTRQALEAGYHVLLEKPPVPVIQQMDRLLEIQRRTGRWCAVGFQNQSKDTVRAVKRAVCEGKLGPLQSIEVMVEWIRDDAYYARNRWAGQIMYEGRYCLDGPTCNATAHYLFNALYWAHPRWGQAAEPRRVRGELYHAHPIPSEDTSAVQIETDNGVTITYLTTLAGFTTRGPLSRLRGEAGVCDWQHTGDAVIRYHDGTEEVLAASGEREHDQVFRNACRYLRGTDSELNCPLDMTRPYVVGLNGLWESARHPVDLAPEYITREPRGESMFTGINDISQWLDQGYESGQTFSDLSAPWAVPTPWVDMTDYREFALFK